MDLLGRKAKARIAELEQANANLNRRLEHWEDNHSNCDAKLRSALNQVDFLVRTIRTIDDQIFRISELADGTWSRIQSNFKTLYEGMIARKTAESSRIGALMERELRSTYTKENTALKQIEDHASKA